MTTAGNGRQGGEGASRSLAARAPQGTDRPHQPPATEPVAVAIRADGASTSSPNGAASRHTASTLPLQPRSPKGARRSAPDTRSAAGTAPGPPDRRLCGLHEAAAYLAVSPWTLRELVWAGQLRRVRLPRVRRLLFDRRDLDALIDTSKR
jgi:excisionase family DNA binding protein